MTGPDDPTQPPGPANDTIPSAPETMPEMVIPKGQAEVHMSAALDALIAAIDRVEQVSMALARAVDAK